MSDDVVLEPVDTTVRPGEIFHFAVRSRGTQGYWFGYDYALERLEGGGWRDVTAEEGFKLARLGVEPGGRIELWANIPDRAQPGTYRVAKEVYAIGSDRPRLLTCELTVA